MWAYIERFGRHQADVIFFSGLFVITYGWTLDPPGPFESIVALVCGPLSLIFFFALNCSYLSVHRRLKRLERRLQSEDASCDDG